MNQAWTKIFLFLVFALGANNIVLGAFWLGSYNSTGPVLLAMALFAIALLTSLFGHRGMRIPAIQGYLNFFIGILIPMLVLGQLAPSKYVASGSYQTWFIGGLSVLLAINSIRGYPILAWIGIGILWIQVIVWGGQETITTSGLIGALIMVIAAGAVGRGIRRTEAEAKVFHDSASRILAQTAKSQAARDERQRLIQATLLTGLPLLERIVATGGDLSDSDRGEAQLLEARFRDEIQGRNLLNDGVRIATRQARQRGVEVTFKDDGGLDGMSAAEVASIHRSVAQAIDGVTAGKVHVAAPRDESYAVSIIATRAGAPGPDLWMRLP
ncbi:MAG: hypothetical protein ACKOWK_01890 [Micrococcales bacterium]